MSCTIVRFLAVQKYIFVNRKARMKENKSRVYIVKQIKYVYEHARHFPAAASRPGGPRA